jgi:predicted nucleic acid-binding protein
MATPTLLRYELASVCRKKAQRHPAQRDALLAALSLLPELGIEELEVPADDVARLAIELEISSYDAAYVWLQQALDAKLVTLDEDLAEAARF